MIPEDVILKIKEENDIVDVISESVNLKKSGRNFIGLCPFHNERTPSFSVSPEKQIFKCFGCGEAGNVITFVMKYRNLSYIDAIKFLADRANIELIFDKKSSKIYKERNEIININREAAKYYFFNLKNNKTAKEYFRNRGIDNKTMVKFGLGYSYGGWDNLIKYLKKKGYSELDMLKAGLIVKSKNGRYRDRFLNRVMFPVFNYRGKVIGFGGRVLDNSKPKYLNSPETDVFKKGDNLYGLNFAIKNKCDFIIIVEGYMDCISLHQFGITNVVASLGTALTPHQAKLIKRFVNKVIISYDADAAGQAATLRGLDILKKQGLEVRVLTVPDGKDPDEYIRMHGKNSFDDLIKNAITLTDYKIKSQMKGIDLDNKEDVIKFMNKVIPILWGLDPIERDIYVKRISEDTGINNQAIFDMINNYNQENTKSNNKVNIIDNNRQKLYLEPAYIRAERGLLNIAINYRDKCEYIFEKVKYEDLILESHKKFYKILNDNVKMPSNELIKLIEVNCNDVESSEEFVKILEVIIPKEEQYLNEVINDYINKLKKYKLEKLKKDIVKKINEYAEQGCLDKSLRLQRKLMEVNGEIAYISNEKGGSE